MVKFNKIMIAISAMSVMAASQATAAGSNDFDVEVYGKLGAAMNTDEGFQVSDRTNEDLSVYSDTKLGLKLGYEISNNFSAVAELKSDFQGQDVDVRAQELYFKAENKMFNTEIGRMRTPVYMNSEIQDDDFALKTYKGARFFSTEQTALETVDGISVGYNTKLQAGKLELNALYGISKDRQFKYYDDASNDSTEYTFEAEDVVQFEGLISTTYGDFRFAYLEANIDDSKIVDDLFVEFDSSSIGYTYDSGSLFVTGELALENRDDVEQEKGYATIGYKTGAFTPYATYASLDVDGDAEAQTSIEAGFGYELNENVALKASYEMLENIGGTADSENDVVSLAVAVTF